MRLWVSGVVELRFGMVQGKVPWFLPRAGKAVIEVAVVMEKLSVPRSLLCLGMPNIQ